MQPLFKKHDTTEAIARLHVKRSFYGLPAAASVRLSNNVSAVDFFNFVLQYGARS